MKKNKNNLYILNSLYIFTICMLWECGKETFYISLNNPLEMVFHDFNHIFNDSFCLSLVSCRVPCHRIWHRIWPSWMLSPPWCPFSPWFPCTTPTKVSIYLNGCSFSVSVLSSSSLTPLSGGVTQGLVWVLLSIHIFTLEITSSLTVPYTLCTNDFQIYSLWILYFAYQTILKYKEYSLGMNRHQYIPYKNHDHLLSPTDFLPVKDISILPAA